MAGHQKIAGLVDVLDIYFDGLYHADIKRLARVFHPDGRYINATQNEYMNYSVQEYFDIVKHRVAPADNRGERNDQIVSIEYGGTSMAFVKITMTMYEREYLDFLTFINGHQGWRIIAKIFSYTPLLKDV